MKNIVKIERKISEALWQKQILDGYFECFDDTLGKTAQLQRIYSSETLKQELESPDSLKFIAHREDELLAFCLVVTDFEKVSVAFANPDRFKRAMTMGEKLWYVTALFSLQKGSGSLRSLLKALACEIVHSGVKLGYDHSEKVKELPQIIRSIAEEFIQEKSLSLKVNDSILGSQTFRLFALE